MTKKARLGLYLEDEDIKRQIKIAAAKRGISTTAYCAQAIEDRLKREGELDDGATKNKLTLLSHMDKLSKEIGPIKKITAELIKEGRHR